MSEGSHLLVRERGAVLVTSVAEVLEAISPIGTHLAARPTGPSRPFDQLDDDLRRTLDAVPVRSARPASRVASDAGLDLRTTQDCLQTLAELSMVEHDGTGWRLAAPGTGSVPQPGHGSA
jgi:DNA processing protein